jgi:hypothetical protein
VDNFDRYFYGAAALCAVAGVALVAAVIVVLVKIAERL